MESNPLLWDLIDLACHLRQERLFVESEKSQLAKLNQEVVCASSKLSQLAWVTAQQRRNLNRLVLSCPDATPSVCCRRATSLHSTQFIDANKIFSFQELVGYGELMSALRDSPALLSHCLVAGERLLPDEMPGVVHSIVSGLFTNCLLPQDKTSILRLLSHLITLQLLPSETPRRMLKHGSCAFARLYSEFHEGHFAAKLFLTAALHAPIMKLLMLEEKYMDIDPEKAIMRLSQEERTKRFGVEGTDSYKEELKKHQEWAVSTLVSITKVFISSLHDNLHCFPSSIWWLVGQIYARLNNNNNVPEKEVFAMCTDLVVTMFLCPAIVTPEPYGIIDAPISPVARFNLMQVAHVIQTLAMYKYQPIDPKHADLYSNFEKDCVSSIIDSILESNIVCDEPPLVDNSKLDGISRNAALFTQSQLNSLISFLKTVANEVSSSDDKTKKELAMLLNQIPVETINGHNTNNNGNTSKTISPERQSATRKASNILAKVTNKPKGNSISENGGPDDDELLVEKVLMIPFDMTNPDFAIGMLSELKIIEMEKVGELERNEQASIMAGERMEGQEKRTRFSLSHDDGSIGNTSDNLEVVSEAPSNHSVASSLELETEDQNDNLSDMVSANVSGRGSPNISGRDTPSSQMTEGDDGGGRDGSVTSASRQHLEFNPRVIPPQPKTTSRFDLDDKFGKFEIKTLIEGGDETISLVSDTWSTDVLASDSETVEATQSESVPPCMTQDPNTSVQLIELSETASEAWSTDVVASDSERMTEIDTDDTASVARSDDTGRSEPDAREEQDVVDESGQSGVLRSSLCEVRGSPTRSETARRRTLEFISNNRNSAFSKNNSSVSGSASDSGGDRLRMPPPTPAFSMDSSLLPSSSSTLHCHHRISFRSVSQPTSTQEVCEELEVVGSVSESAGVSGFSTASIASSSSSASSSEPRHNHLSGNTDESRLNPMLTPNGSVVTESSSKASPSGTAIPKSISFDKTAERGDKESHDDDSKHKKGFFKSFKLSFRNRRGKNFRSTDSYEHMGPGDLEGIPSIRIRRGLSEEMRPYRNVSEMSEDILAKYRRKSPGGTGESIEVKVKPTTQEQPPPIYTSFPFDDAKKKLRLVLSNAEFQQIPDVLPAMRNAWMQKENELVAFLQLQLAEAINLQDRNLIPQLHETLRCVRMFSERESRSVVESLREDYKIRSSYITYLVKCRQSLLQTLSHLERLNDQVKSDGQAVLEFLTSVCVRFFIERRESQLNKFITEFQSLTLGDEKCDLIESFLQQLFNEIDRDPLWHYASDEQLSHAQTTIERFLFSRVYFHAMYPNGDGDIFRDQVLHDHMNKLSKVITPSHKDIRIPKEYHCECPWLSAQAELSQIGAFRTPRDKLHCALRAIYTINKLLSLSCQPAADDLTPVLVFVLIMANPPSLLSTIEYVTTFYGSRLEGEEHYYWTQFCSAIEFIKTMDYSL